MKNSARKSVERTTRWARWVALQKGRETVCDDDGEGGESLRVGVEHGGKSYGVCNTPHAIVEFCKRLNCSCSSILSDAGQDEVLWDGRGRCTARDDEHTSRLPRVWQRRLRGQQVAT